MKARKLRRLLEREFGYVVVNRRGGSHRVMQSPEYPMLTFSYHDNEEVGGWMVRTILVKQVGLNVEEAKEVFRRA